MCTPADQSKPIWSAGVHRQNPMSGLTNCYTQHRRLSEAGCQTLRVQLTLSV